MYPVRVPPRVDADAVDEVSLRKFDNPQSVKKIHICAEYQNRCQILIKPTEEHEIRDQT